MCNKQTTYPIAPMFRLSTRAPPIRKTKHVSNCNTSTQDQQTISLTVKKNKNKPMRQHHHHQTTKPPNDHTTTPPQTYRATLAILGTTQWRSLGTPTPTNIHTCNPIQSPCALGSVVLGTLLFLIFSHESFFDDRFVQPKQRGS